MHIDFKRSGGFAGLSMSKTLDTDNLNPDEFNRLIGLVESSGFFDLPPVIPGIGVDQYQYNLTIDWDRKIHSVRVSESAIPPKLMALVKWIEGK